MPQVLQEGEAQGSGLPSILVCKLQSRSPHSYLPKWENRMEVTQNKRQRRWWWWLKGQRLLQRQFLFNENQQSYFNNQGPAYNDGDDIQDHCQDENNYNEDQDNDGNTIENEGAERTMFIMMLMKMVIQRQKLGNMEYLSQSTLTKI